MLGHIRQRIADMRTIQILCQAAERHANAMGERAPGPEHFLLAALDLPDGTAHRAFEAVGVAPGRLRDAIAAHHRSALGSAGIDPGLLEDDTPTPPAAGLYQSKGSMQSIMQELAAWPRTTGEALTGAHVVAVIAGRPLGTAAGALRALGVDAAELVSASRQQIHRHATAA